MDIHPQFIVDQDNQRKGVLLTQADWERVVELIEDAEDTIALDKAMASGESPVPFEEAVKRIEAGK